MWHKPVLQLQQKKKMFASAEQTMFKMPACEDHIQTDFSVCSGSQLVRRKSKAKCALHHCTHLNLSAIRGTPSCASAAHDWDNFYNSARIHFRPSQDSRPWAGAYFRPKYRLAHNSEKKGKMISLWSAQRLKTTLFLSVSVSHVLCVSVKRAPV